MTNPPLPPQPSESPQSSPPAPGPSHPQHRSQPFPQAGQPQPGQPQPGQPYPQAAQPYGPGQPYPQPGRPYPPTDRAGSAAPRRRNPAGLFAVILVAVALALQLVASIVSAVLITGSDVAYEAYGAFTGVIVVLQGLVAIAAIILGAIGLAARDRPKALAGMGLGGGTVVLFGILSSQLTTLLLTVFSGL